MWTCGLAVKNNKEYDYALNFHCSQSTQQSYRESCKQTTGRTCWVYKQHFIAFSLSFILGTQSQLNVERSKSRMGTFVETIPTAAEGSQDDGWDIHSPPQKNPVQNRIHESNSEHCLNTWGIKLICTVFDLGQQFFNYSSIYNFTWTRRQIEITHITHTPFITFATQCIPFFNMAVCLGPERHLIPLAVISAKHPTSLWLARGMDGLGFPFTSTKVFCSSIEVTLYSVPGANHVQDIIFIVAPCDIIWSY